MGYRWQDNPYDDLGYDLLIFKTDSVRVVRVRQVRSHIGPEKFYEKDFPDEVAGLRSLPFPPYIVREIWLKTRGERVYRRLHVTDVSVGEIEWWGPDGYTNPHIKKEIKGKPGPTGKFIVRTNPNPAILPPPAASPKGEAGK